MMIRSRCLTFLHSSDDLACVEALRPKALRGAVIAFGLDLHLQLLDRGIEHLTPMDFVDRREWPLVVELEAAVRRFWSDHARVSDQGVDLLSLARIRHVSWLRRMTWAAYVTRRALETLRPREVVVLEEPAGHGLDQPSGYRRWPLLMGLVRGIAEQAGCRVDALRCDQPGWSTFEDRTADNARRSGPPIPLDARLSGPPWILVHGNVSDLLRQAPLIEGLLEQTDFAVVQSYSSATPSQLRQLAAIGHCICHVSQLANHGAAADGVPQAKQTRARFDDAARRAPAELRGIFGNRYLKTHFDFIFGPYLEAMAQHVHSWRCFFSTYRPAAFISTFPTPLGDMALHCGIPSLHLPHGLLILGMPELYTTLDGGIVGALGAPHRDRLIEAGLDPHRVRVTGDPYLDPMLKGMADGDGGPARARSSADLVVLLLSGGMDTPSSGATLPMIDWADAARAAEALGPMLARHPEWRFVIKRHPRRDHPRLYERIGANGRLTIAGNEPLRELVDRADAVVSFNCPTSAIVEASLWGKPVMILDTSMIWFDHEAYATASWPILHSVGELERALVDMFADDAAYRAFTTRTRFGVHAFFGGPPEPALPRCLALIDELASGGGGRSCEQLGRLTPVNEQSR